MKFSESWLREWVNPDWSSQQLMDELTMAGLEVDGFESVADAFAGVIVGEVLECDRHPDADKLSVCIISDGSATQQVVCGAPNVRAGLRVAYATVGAVLGGDFKIKKAKLRGVESFGMLCSAKELGLGDDHDGILELDEALVVGSDLRDALSLDDRTIELDLTPNRGDALSVRGIAREVAVLSDEPVSAPTIKPVEAEIDESFPVRLDAPDGCPRYLGRVIRGVDVSRPTPAWMVEKLRRCGIRSIDPVVDVTNFIVLELGQPMHAFDLSRLAGSICVRRGHTGEQITLLDGRTVDVDESVLLITDDNGPLAMAGVMGGENSGISSETVDVFLEVAFFAPLAIAGTPRRYALNTDASHRYERGVDYELGFDAIERATRLLLDIVGGKPGPVVETVARDHLPKPAVVELRQSRLDELLGVQLPPHEVDRQLARLDFPVESRRDTDDGVIWHLVSPSHRFDIAAEIDLVEEVCRIYGYNEIAGSMPSANLPLGRVPRRLRPERAVKQVLASMAYHEAVSYSFVDPGLQDLLSPGEPTLQLANPLSSDLSVMRTTLLPGLVAAAQGNAARQQPRIRLFEVGRCFLPSDGALEQVDRIGGLLTGLRVPQNWASTETAVDFFDAKGDVEQLLELTGAAVGFQPFEASPPALHPGQSSQVLLDGEVIGWLGRLHPEIAQRVELPGAYVFELDAAAVYGRIDVRYQAVSRFPSVRRDFALLVDKAVSAADIEACVKGACGERLVDFTLFDVYEGEGIDSNEKSLAIGLTFQDASATLADGDIGRLTDVALQALKTSVGARQR